MIYSMTGYGEASFSYNGNATKIELRALNGKNIDVRLRLPNKYKSQELKLRKLVLSKLERGKIDFFISITDLDKSNSQLNLDLIKQYIQDLKKIQEEENLTNSDILSAVFTIPNIHDHIDLEPDTEELKILFKTVEIAIDKIIDYRSTEGESLHVDMVNRINAIVREHEKVGSFITERNNNISERIRANLDKSVGMSNVDENRFEQEIIYYLDKLDINEEQVRLEQNCKYFLEVVATEGHVKGKKLGFIAQEIGREINTLGSKAQHSDIQRLVVIMKDELEKLKEQLANIM